MSRGAGLWAGGLSQRTVQRGRTSQGPVDTDAGAEASRTWPRREAQKGGGWAAGLVRGGRGWSQGLESGTKQAGETESFPLTVLQVRESGSCESLWRRHRPPKSRLPTPTPGALQAWHCLGGNTFPVLSRTRLAAVPSPLPVSLSAQTRAQKLAAGGPLAESRTPRLSPPLAHQLTLGCAHSRLGPTRWA